MDDVPASVADYTDQSLSAIHHTLRSARRRLVVGLIAHKAINSSSIQREQNFHRPLRGKEASVSVRRLAKEVVVLEEKISIEQATGEPYHNVYTALIQTHLPELDDVGAVDYNSDRKTVRPDQNLAALAMAAAITSPMAQMLFHNAISNTNLGGNTQ